MKLFANVFLFISVCFLPLDLSAQSVKETHDGILFQDSLSWGEVLNLSAQSGKPIFVDCYTSWCAPCKALAKQVFVRSEVGAYFNPRFINVKYDMEQGEGKLLYERYKAYIPGFPTLLLVDARGEVIHRLSGYQEPERLLANVQEAMKGKSLPALEERYARGERSLAFMRDYMQCLKDAFLKERLQTVAGDYLKQMDVAELERDEVWQLLGSYVTDIQIPAFGYLVQHLPQFHLKLKRDYYTLHRQVKNVLYQEERRLTRIAFDSLGCAYPLVSEPEAEERLLDYMQRADVPRLNAVRASLYVKRLLVARQYQEAWRVACLCNEMNFSSFPPHTLHEYIRYMMSRTTDKRLLRTFLEKLESYVRDEETLGMGHGVYRTMGQLHKQLGHRTEAQTLQERFEEMEAGKQAEFARFLQRKDN